MPGSRLLLKLLFPLAAFLALLRLAEAQSEGPIRIGYALPRTGQFAAPAQIIQEPNYILWAEQVNARGGLDVQGKRRKVELVGYDDQSDFQATPGLYEKLMTADKVDLILAPWGTVANTAVAPIASQHGYPMIASTISSRRVFAAKLPFFFCTLQQPDKMMEALVDLLAAKGVKTVGVLFMDDLFGQEHIRSLMPYLKIHGITVAEEKSYPLGVKDLSSTLKEMKAKNVDAFLGLTYPPDGLLATKQAREIGFNPKVFYTAVGTAFPLYREVLGPGVEGLMGMGSWNPHTGAAAKAYFDAHVVRWHKEPDRWASGHTWAGLQILQEAVAKVGLDRQAIRDYIAGHEFQTIIGPVRFQDGENASTPGMVSQWQKGEFEVVWPAARATAPLLFPKTAWR